MRELSVYYCSKCGHYAFYQLPKNAVCYRCSCPMTPLNISHQDFIRLDHQQRDRLIAVTMIQSANSPVSRITAPERLYCQRKLVGALIQYILELESEIDGLNQTIDWMHETVWKLLCTKQELTRQIQDMKAVTEPQPPDSQTFSQELSH